MRAVSIGLLPFAYPVALKRVRIIRSLYLLLIAVLFVQCSAAQTETYDIITYTPPSGWKKEIKSSSVVYTKANNKNNSFCIVNIYKSIPSKGSIEHDFTSDWQDFVVTPYKVTVAPTLEEVQDTDGWKVKSGTAPFTFSNTTAHALLTTMTGYNTCVSVLTLTNSGEYAGEVESLFNSMNLAKTGSNNTPGQTTTEGTTEAVTNANNTDAGTNGANNSTTTGAPGSTSSKADGYKFNTTNFDDGWVSTIQEDWVEVTKGNVKVLLHYPNNPALKYAADDVKTLTNKAWNALVAPRYTDLSNFDINYNVGFEQAMMGSGNVTDKASGQHLFVAIFQRASSPWMEFICPDKATFEQTFNVPVKFDYYAHNELFNPLLKMAGCNKFAVAPSDLSGEWTSDFTGMTQYVNVYTGASAGAYAHSSGAVFNFTAAGGYSWELSVASGMVGSQRFQQVKSKGQFSLPSNWELYCPDIEGKPRTYSISFACIKGARILVIDGKQYAKK
jgi:hypothetical protein